MFTILKELNACIITILRTVSTILTVIAKEVENDLKDSDSTKDNKKQK